MGRLPEDGLAKRIEGVNEARSEIVRRACQWAENVADMSRIRALFRATIVFKRLNAELRDFEAQHEPRDAQTQTLVVRVRAATIAAIRGTKAIRRRAASADVIDHWVQEAVDEKLEREDQGRGRHPIRPTARETTETLALAS